LRKRNSRLYQNSQRGFGKHDIRSMKALRARPKISDEATY
jgi:hypothetical protein